MASTWRVRRCAPRWKLWRRQQRGDSASGAMVVRHSVRRQLRRGPPAPLPAASSDLRLLRGRPRMRRTLAVAEDELGSAGLVVSRGDAGAALVGVVVRCCCWIGVPASSLHSLPLRRSPCPLPSPPPPLHRPRDDEKPPEARVASAKAGLDVDAAAAPEALYGAGPCVSEEKEVMAIGLDTKEAESGGVEATARRPSASPPRRACRHSAAIAPPPAYRRPRLGSPSTPRVAARRVRRGRGRHNSSSLRSSLPPPASAPLPLLRQCYHADAYRLDLA